MSIFSNNIKRLRKEKRFTLEELANDINKKQNTKYAKGTISKWESGTDPSMDSVKNLAEYFNMSINELLGVDIEEDDINEIDMLIPILGTISAGVPLYAEQNIIGYTVCPPLFKNSNHDIFYLKVHGESMNKEFPDGSDVLVDKNEEIQNGDIAVVLINGFEATVKKVKYDDHKIILIPMSTDDSFYAKKYDLAKDEITLIGKVIGAYKSFK